MSTFIIDYQHWKGTIYTYGRVEVVGSDWREAVRNLKDNRKKMGFDEVIDIISVIEK